MTARCVVTAAEIFQMIAASGIPDGPDDYTWDTRRGHGGRKPKPKVACKAGQGTQFACNVIATKKGLCGGHHARQLKHGDVYAEIPLSRRNRRDGGLGRVQ